MEFVFDTIATQLQLPGDGVFRDTAWLHESRRRPHEFARALLRHYSALAPAPLKSNAEAGYDFYHDLVLRHRASPHAALQWTSLDTGPQALSYAALHAACSRRCAAWAAQGVRAGASLCVLGALGPELLIALLSGLRLGLKVSLLPPLGPDFLARRLRALPAVHIAAAPHYRMLLPDPKQSERILNDERPVEFGTAGPAAPTEVSSHTYAPDEPALALYSPLSEPQEEPIGVPAAVAYHGALRDGLLLLGLRPGKVLAAPAHSLLQSQPALLMTTLLHGATFQHIQARDLAPQAPEKPGAPPHLLLVSTGLRDAMLALPPRPLQGVQRWVINPQEPPGKPWEDWARRFGLQATPVSALLLDAAGGGACLFSLPQVGAPPLMLQPAPGLPFTLLSPDDSGEPARTGAGIWDPRPGTAGLLLSPRDGAFVYGGTVAPTQHGRCYPTSEVEAVVSALPFVLAASVVTPSGGTGAPALLIFTGPEPLEKAQALQPRREAALRATIRTKLGEEFVPTEIAQYAMFPRCKGSAVDHAWCAEHHRRGHLRRRERHALSRILDRLRAACLRPPTESPPPKTLPQPALPQPALPQQPLIKSSIQRSER